MSDAELLVAAAVAALADADEDVLSGMLDEHVRLRALLPRRSVDLAGRAAVVDEMLGWFDDVPSVVAVATAIDTVGDLVRVTYRFALRGLAIEQVVEQAAFVAVADGRITLFRLVCSGFRPAFERGSPPPDAADRGGSREPDHHRDHRRPTEVAAPPPVRRLDGLGHGCATLTPLIASALRELGTGDVIEVVTDDPAAPDGIAAWSRLTGHTVVATADGDAGLHVYLRHA
jgi:TusA-related sulfurtransferase